MKILHIGIMANAPNGWTAALDRQGQCEHIPLNQLNKVNGQSADMIFIQLQQAGILSNEKIKALKGFKVNWCGDVRDPLPVWYLDTANVVDVTAFSNRRDVESMSAFGYRADFVEIGFDPEIYFPTSQLKYVDVVFCANHFGVFPLSGLRQQIAQRMTNTKEFIFRLHGIGWGGNITWLNQQQEAEAYRTAKIAINCSHFDFYTSDRMWRILGSGAMCLSHHYTGIEQDVEVGKHLDTWKTLEELEEKMNWYLGHEDERAEIADAGCKFAHANQTFDKMAERFVKLKG